MSRTDKTKASETEEPAEKPVKCVITIGCENPYAIEDMVRLARKVISSGAKNADVETEIAWLSIRIEENYSDD